MKNIVKQYQELLKMKQDIQQKIDISKTEVIEKALLRVKLPKLFLSSSKSWKTASTGKYFCGILVCV